MIELLEQETPLAAEGAPEPTDAGGKPSPFGGDQGVLVWLQYIRFLRRTADPGLARAVSGTLRLCAQTCIVGQAQRLLSLVGALRVTRYTLADGSARSGREDCSSSLLCTSGRALMRHVHQTPHCGHALVSTWWFVDLPGACSLAWRLHEGMRSAPVTLHPQAFLRARKWQQSSVALEPLAAPDTKPPPAGSTKQHRPCGGQLYVGMARVEWSLDHSSPAVPCRILELVSCILVVFKIMLLIYSVVSKVSSPAVPCRIVELW